MMRRWWRYVLDLDDMERFEFDACHGLHVAYAFMLVLVVASKDMARQMMGQISTEVYQVYMEVWDIIFIEVRASTT